VWRAVMFETVPLVVSEYSPAAATLGLDWFDEIRAEAKPAQAFTPTPRLTVTDDDVAAMIARVTVRIHELETGLQPEVDNIVADAGKCARCRAAEVRRVRLSGHDHRERQG
jgi:hypothetical protein